MSKEPQSTGSWSRGKALDHRALGRGLGKALDHRPLGRGPEAWHLSTFKCLWHLSIFRQDLWPILLDFYYILVVNHCVYTMEGQIMWWCLCYCHAEWWGDGQVSIFMELYQSSKLRPSPVSPPLPTGRASDVWPYQQIKLRKSRLVIVFGDIWLRWLATGGMPQIFVVCSQ